MGHCSFLLHTSGQFCPPQYSRHGTIRHGRAKTGPHSHWTVVGMSYLRETSRVAIHWRSHASQSRRPTTQCSLVQSTLGESTGSISILSSLRGVFQSTGWIGFQSNRIVECQFEGCGRRQNGSFSWIPTSIPPFRGRSRRGDHRGGSDPFATHRGKSGSISEFADQTRNGSASIGAGLVGTIETY